MRFAPTSFRPTFGRVMCIAMALIAGAGLAGFIAIGDWSGLVRYGWALLLVAALCFALFWIPRVDVAEHEVTIVNVFSTLHIPWPAIQNVDTKFALTLYTPTGRVTAWASPAPGRYASQVSRTWDTRLAAKGLGANPRPGDLLSTASGAAAFMIRTHWEELREDGHLDDPVVEGGELRRDIHWVTIGVLGALLLACVLGVLL